MFLYRLPAGHQFLKYIQSHFSHFSSSSFRLGLVSAAQEVEQGLWFDPCLLQSAANRVQMLRRKSIKKCVNEATCLKADKKSSIYHLLSLNFSRSSDWLIRYLQ